MREREGEREAGRGAGYCWAAIPGHTCRDAQVLSVGRDGNTLCWYWINFAQRVSFFL